MKRGIQIMSYPNTLLGYFKTGISKAGESTKYFNRDFLAIYLAEYKESKNNIPENVYEKQIEISFFINCMID